MDKLTWTGVQPIAPVAPLNSTPAPIAAFGMGQPAFGSVPMMQPYAAGIMPPMAAVPGVVPGIPVIPPSMPILQLFYKKYFS